VNTKPDDENRTTLRTNPGGSFFAYLLKQIKHVIKKSLIVFSPSLYWTLRCIILGYPEPELKLMDLFCSRKLIAIDVGANYSMYTYFASKRFSHCYAFEPQPYFENVYRKGYKNSNVSLEQVALSDKIGTATMRVPICDRGYSTIEKSNQLEGKVDETRGIEQIEVKTTCLDHYGFKDVGFLKVDVEGHELEVLQGAMEIIRASLPVVLVEVEERHREGSVLGVVSLLTSLGYECFFLYKKKRLAFSQFSLDRHQNQERRCDYIRNFVFFHPGKHAAIYLT